MCLVQKKRRLGNSKWGNRADMYHCCNKRITSKMHCFPNI